MSNDDKSKLEEYEQRIERYQIEIIKLHLKLHSNAGRVEVDSMVLFCLSLPYVFLAGWLLAELIR